MKKLILLVAILWASVPAFADSIAPPALPTPPLQTVTDQFSVLFLNHISAVDSFRQDGSHVIKFSDGIIQAIPYKGDNILIGSFGIIPKPQDSTKFYNSYSIHAHVLSFLAKYVDINPTYAPILADLELTPGYTYDTDVHHGGFDFSVGYAHKFGQ